MSNSLVHFAGVFGRWKNIMAVSMKWLHGVHSSCYICTNHASICLFLDSDFREHAAFLNWVLTQWSSQAAHQWWDSRELRIERENKQSLSTLHKGRLIAQGHKAQNQMETCGRDLAILADFVLADWWLLYDWWLNLRCKRQVREGNFRWVHHAGKVESAVSKSFFNLTESFSFSRFFRSTLILSHLRPDLWTSLWEVWVPKSWWEMFLILSTFYR